MKLNSRCGSLMAAFALSILSAAAIAADPEEPGADFSAPVTLRQLTVTQVVVASLTIDLPSPGVVIVNSGGYTVFNDNPSSVACSITKQTNISHEPQIYVQGRNEPNAKRMTVATTRGFREREAGPKTYNFVCGANVGKVDLVDIVLTGIYVPKRY